MRAAEDKDPGNTNSKSISDFAILQVPPVEHLLSVAKHSCVVFSTASGSPLEALSLIRAKELSQAELALARHKIKAEAAREKVEAAQKKASAHDASPTMAHSMPEGSGTEGVNAAPTAKWRKGIKVAVPQGKRPLTRQGRANGMGS
jgi:hypothetical protein